MFAAIAALALAAPEGGIPALETKMECETWLCAGQSNMQKGWGEFNRMPEEKARVEGEMARLAKCDIMFWDFNDGKWTNLTPDNALRKSAFGVSFAIRRAEKTQRQIRILYVAAGGAPTEPFLIDGILWYQGESNATTCTSPDIPTPEDYQLETLRATIAELRGGRNIPFIMMGLPKMNRPWERYREAQRKACEETGAVFVDTFAAGLGEADDVHPRDKVPFADLAAAAARDALPSARTDW